MSVKPEPSFRRILRYSDVNLKNAQVMTELFLRQNENCSLGDSTFEKLLQRSGGRLGGQVSIYVVLVKGE